MPSKQYRLDKEAFDLYRQAYLKLEDLRCDINTKPAMSHVWGKSEGRIGKIALGLHKINSVIAGVEPPEVIGRKTIKAAISLTNFYARQVEALYATLDGKTELPGNLAKILELAQRKGDYLLPRDVIINTSKKVNSVEVKQWFTQLADLGYGETQKTPRSLKFKLTIRNVDNVDANVDLNINITQASQNKNYSSNVDNVDNVDPFPDFWTSTDETDNTVDSNLTGSVSAEGNGIKGEKINVTNIPNLEDETVTSKGINNVDSNVDGESTFPTSVEHENKNGKKINVTNIANLEEEKLTSKGINNVDSNVDGESTFSTLVGHESKNDKKINVDSNVGSKKIQWVKLKDGKILNCHEYSGQFDRRGYIYGRQFGLIKKEKAHRTQVIEIRYGDE